MDTARADAVEPYGAPPGATPSIRALAARGVAVPAVHATANWTLPSHASLLSGRLPRALGIGSGPTLAEVMAANEDVLLAPVLHDEGWHTIAISANPFVSPFHGFGAGFDRFFEVRSARRAAGPGLRGRVRSLLDGLLADVDDGLSAVEETFQRALGEAPADRPWFAFVNLMECHAPYLPPRPWNDLGPRGRLVAADDVRRYQSHAAVVAASMGELAIPPAAIRRMRHLYEAAVSMMDAWIGRALELLSRRGELADTLVLVTSDHGENLGECGRLGHTLSVDERLLHVPLVAAGPHLDVDDVISIADVPRVVARATGLGRHPWARPACPDGVAVAQNDGYRAVHPAFSEMFTREWHLDAAFKLVRVGDEQRLHDLHADPLERVDVSEGHPDQVARLSRSLDDVEPAAVVSTQPAGPATGATSDADMVDRLRLLGYV
jgi:arylsulfatase A-like enzyme